MSKRKIQEQGIDIPLSVTNEDAYLEMLERAKHPILHEKRYYECSDETIVNVGMFPHALRKKIEHLPEEEINKVLKLNKIFYKVNNKVTALKTKAFTKLANSRTSGGILFEHKQEVLELFGKMFTIDEVVEILTEKWQFPISRTMVGQFRQRYANKIENLIEEHKAGFADIRLGVKRSRLEELTVLYGRMKRKWELKQYRDDYKLLIQTLESIRKEAEGDQVTINGKLDLSYEVNMNVHLRNEVFKTLNLKEIILGRVASRMGISAPRLVASLNNSFYSRFSNVLGTLDHDSKEQISYPSQMSYDFERIRKNQQFYDQEMEDVEAVEVHSEDEVQNGETKKESLLEALKRKRGNIKAKQQEIDSFGIVNDKRKEK